VSGKRKQRWLGRRPIFFRSVAMRCMRTLFLLI